MTKAICVALFLATLGFTGGAYAQTAQSCQGNSYTPGSNTKVACSKTFSFSGQCGVPVQPGWGDVAIEATPWESSSITLIEESVAAYFQLPPGGAPITYMAMFGGNSYQPDPATPRVYGVGQGPGNAYGTLLTEATYPAGTGMQFPAASNSGVHLDVHIYCLPAGTSYLGEMQVWYTVP